MIFEPHHCIMIVDDEASIVSMLQDVMNLAGFKCQGYTDPQKALTAFLQNPQAYKVMITDLTMPGMKGDELALAAGQANPHCKIILTSGYQADSLTANLKDFTLLQKPYHIEKLLALIRSF